jgi:hypothetical protein
MLIDEVESEPNLNHMNLYVERFPEKNYAELFLLARYANRILHFILSCQFRLFRNKLSNTSIFFFIRAY